MNVWHFYCCLSEPNPAIIYIEIFIVLTLTLFHTPFKLQAKVSGTCYLHSITLQSGNIWMVLEQKAWVLKCVCTVVELPRSHLLIRLKYLITHIQRRITELRNKSVIYSKDNT